MAQRHAVTKATAVRYRAASMSPEVRAQLCSMSAATIDRRLAGERAAEQTVSANPHDDETVNAAQ